MVWVPIIKIDWLIEEYHMEYSDWLIDRRVPQGVQWLIDWLIDEYHNEYIDRYINKRVPQGVQWLIDW